MSKQHKEMSVGSVSEHILSGKLATARPIPSEQQSNNSPHHPIPYPSSLTSQYCPKVSMTTPFCCRHCRGLVGRRRNDLEEDGNLEEDGRKLRHLLSPPPSTSSAGGYHQR